MESINRMAIELVDELFEFAEELNVGGYDLADGTAVLDCGFTFDGGLEAGLLVTEIQTAGLATPRIDLDDVGPATLPHVSLVTDQPALALLCSQKAGWELVTEDFEGLASGPVRALVAAEPAFERVGYVDAFDLTAVVLEAEMEPTDAVAERVAEAAAVDPGGIHVIAFPAASVVGSVTNAARAAELAVDSLVGLGADPHDVISAAGRAPVAPVPPDELTAVARATDALAHGAEATLFVREDVPDVEALPARPPDGGERPFTELFATGELSPADVTPEQVGPATVTVDVVDGPTHVVGSRREGVLAESFGVAHSG